MRLKKETKSQLEKIKEYLLKNGEITTKQADEFGWDRIRQNIYTLKQKGMNIISLKPKYGETTYKLVDKNENKNEFEIIDLVEETPPTADDMKIKTSMKEVILDHLKKHGSITSFDAMGRYNCLNLYVIIKALKKEGYKITRSNVKVSSVFNKSSNRSSSYLVYTLESPLRKKTVYTISVTGDGVSKELVEITDKISFDKESKAFDRAVELANNIIKHYNTLFGSNSVSFIPDFGISPNYHIDVIKRETIKKLFSKKLKDTRIITFNIVETEKDLEE